MAMTDPIADMLTRIRNACTARHVRVDIPASKMKRAIAEVLTEEGFARGYKEVEDDKQGIIRLYLRYAGPRQAYIHEIQRVSSPGRRVYVNTNDLPQVKNGYGVAIISTSRGVMKDQAARDLGVGGEVVCTVW